MEPFVEGPGNGGRVGLAVPGKYPHPSVAEGAHRAGGHAFGGEGHERCTGTETAEKLEVLRLERAEIAALVGPGSLRVEVRSFDVKPQNPERWSAGFIDRFRDRAQSFSEDLAPRANEGGQEARGSVLLMGPSDRADGLDVRVIVEQDVVPAVDLEVHKARGQQPRVVLQGDPGWRAFASEMRDDAPVLEGDAGVAVQGRAVKKPIGAERGRVACHRVYASFKSDGS